MTVLKHLQEQEKQAQISMREEFYHYVKRRPESIILVGNVSVWCRGHRTLKWTEAWLESLVVENILRPATAEELEPQQLVHGYYLTETGLQQLYSERTKA